MNGHILAAVAAVLAATSLVAACDGGSSEPGTAASGSPGENASPDASGNLLDKLDPNDRQNFAGDGQIGDKVAAIDLPQFEDEKSFLADRDTASFARKGMVKFPEIKRVRFGPTADMKGDPDDLQNFRDSFYAGLYYAEMIRTGDGRTLFDLITKCGRLKDPESGATLAPPLEGHSGWWVGLQYFPTFRMAGDTQTVDLQILFERDGMKLTARSPLFSSHLLDQNSFMHDHGIECL